MKQLQTSVESTEKDTHADFSLANKRSPKRSIFSCQHNPKETFGLHKWFRGTASECAQCRTQLPDMFFYLNQGDPCLECPFSVNCSAVLTIMSPLHSYKQWWANSWLVPPPQKALEQARCMRSSTEAHTNSECEQQRKTTTFLNCYFAFGVDHILLSLNEG